MEINIPFHPLINSLHTTHSIFFQRRKFNRDGVVCAQLLRLCAVDHSESIWTVILKSPFILFLFWFKIKIKSRIKGRWGEVASPNSVGSKTRADVLIGGRSQNVERGGRQEARRFIGAHQSQSQRPGLASLSASIY